MNELTDKYFNETEDPKIYKKLSDESNCAIIYTTTDLSQESKRSKETSLLLSEVRKNFICADLIGRWVDENGVSYYNNFIIVYDITLKAAARRSLNYSQNTIVFKNKDSCREVCVEPSDLGDKKIVIKDVVRVIRKTDGVLTAEDARKIFDIKNDARYSLVEVYRICPPRPSYFQTTYSRIRIL